MTRYIFIICLFYWMTSCSLAAQGEDNKMAILQERLIEYVDYYKKENPSDLEEINSFAEDFIYTSDDTTTASALIEECIMATIAAQEKGIGKISNGTLLRILRSNIKAVLKGTKHHKKLTKDHIKLFRRNKEILGLFSSQIINVDSSTLTPFFIEESNFYNLEEGDIIADIGGGIGTVSLAYSFLPVNLEIHCTEIDKNLYKYQKALFENLPSDFRYSKVSLQKGTESDTELKKKHFNKVILRNTFHHFSQISEMLESIQSIMTTEGQLFILEDFREEDVIPYCYKMTTEKEFLSNMEGKGFTLEETKTIGPSTLLLYKKSKSK